MQSRLSKRPLIKSEPVVEIRTTIQSVKIKNKFNPNTERIFCFFGYFFVVWGHFWSILVRYWLNRDECDGSVILTILSWFLAKFLKIVNGFLTQKSQICYTKFENQVFRHHPGIWVAWFSEIKWLNPQAKPQTFHFPRWLGIPEFMSYRYILSGFFPKYFRCLANHFHCLIGFYESPTTSTTSVLYGIVHANFFELFLFSNWKRALMQSSTLSRNMEWWSFQHRCYRDRQD